MTIPFLDLKAQYAAIKDEVDAAIADVIGNTAFVGGKALSDFEAAFAKYCGVGHCVGVDNGTDALQLALIALGIGRGDEVILPANSFVATAEAVSHCGAIPVFVDCDDHYQMNPALIEAKISLHTKAIIPVHLYGHPADMDAIMKIAREHKIKVVEDAAQAHGATHKGRPVGSLGDMACFSFYPGKNLGAYGNGGAVVSKKADYIEHIRMLTNHGQKTKYEHQIIGLNSRLDGLQAAVLNVKLRYLDAWNKRRRQIADQYTELLKTAPVSTPNLSQNIEPVWHLYVIQADKRDSLQAHLKEQGIATGIHYPEGIPFVKAYRYLKHKAGDYPRTHKNQTRLLSLPIYPEMRTEQAGYVVKNILEFYR
jgi:dTDP-4-amino-4,6-dideoxygalactose transaminase